jgi:DNA-binding response OmpR family regulator
VTKRILVVDDNAEVRALVRRVLDGGGYGVEEAEDGNAGLRAFRRQPPDLVILDMVMPDKEGLETLRELRQLSPDLPIIAVSGGGIGDARDYLTAAQHFGASRVLQKPFDMNVLRVAIAELLGDRRNSAEGASPIGDGVDLEQSLLAKLVWHFRRDDLTWSCRLQTRGEHGVEAQILRDGVVVNSQRFAQEGTAISWAERERVAIEKGGV